MESLLSLSKICSMVEASVLEMLYYTQRFNLRNHQWYSGCLKVPCGKTTEDATPCVIIWNRWGFLRKDTETISTSKPMKQKRADTLGCSSGQDLSVSWEWGDKQGLVLRGSSVTLLEFSPMDTSSQQLPTHHHVCCGYFREERSKTLSLIWIGVIV